MKVSDFNDFVSKMLASGDINPHQSTPTPLGETQTSTLDISQVVVPDTLVESLVGKTTSKKETVAKPQTPKVESPDLNNLVTEFIDTVTKAKRLLQELTTCGMIGTNTASKPTKKKVIKYGYPKITKKA